MKITVVAMDDLGYNDFIPEELKKRNIEVTYIKLYNNRYKYPNILYKVLNFFLKFFLNYNLKRVHIEKHLLQRLEKLEIQDHILVTRADLLNISTVIKMKKYTKNILANFNDHTEKFPRIKKVAPYFDKVFSFQKNDVERYGFNFITNYSYIKGPIIKNSNTKIKWQVFNVSRLDRRIDILEKISKSLNQLKIPNRIIVVGNNKFKKNKIHNLEHTTLYMPIEEVQDLIMKSNAMLDVVCRDDQSGLSFRVFESMMYRKKLITSNVDIINYDFYNPNNILVVNKEVSNITKEFFETEYQDIDEEIYNKYTLKSWVEKVFDL